MIQLFCKSLYPHFPSGYDNAASPAPLRAGIIFVPICEYKWKGATTRNNSKATFFILLFVKAIFCWAISEVYYILTLSHWRRSILLVQTVCETQKTHPQPQGCVKMCDLSQLIKKSASFSGEDGIRTLLRYISENQILSISSSLAGNDLDTKRSFFVRTCLKEPLLHCKYKYSFLFTQIILIFLYTKVFDWLLFGGSCLI